MMGTLTPLMESAISGIGPLVGVWKKTIAQNSSATFGLMVLTCWKGLKTSTADWKIVVTHFPGHQVATDVRLHGLHKQYGIDLLFTGHEHQQRSGVTNEMAWIVSGGGGGVTTDSGASCDGNDDAYGFIDFTINRDELVANFHSHGGHPDSKEAKQIFRNSVPYKRRQYQWSNLTASVSSATMTMTPVTVADSWPASSVAMSGKASQNSIYV